MKTERPHASFSSLAVVGLVLSFSSILLWPLGFIPGIVIGHISVSRGKKGSADRLLGIVSLVVGYVFLVLFIVVCWMMYQYGQVHGA